MIRQPGSSIATPFPVRIAIASISCVALAVGLGACGGGDDGGGGDGTITFGADTQLSGNLQVYGLPAVQGLESAAAALNDDGGIDAGDSSYDAAVAAEDNKSDPSAVASAARAVVDAGAIAALGPDISAPVAYEIWSANDVITFTPAFNLQATLQKDPEGNPLLFSPVPFLSEVNFNSLNQTLAQVPDIKTVAILAPNDDVGIGSSEAYAFAAEKLGLTVVGRELYEIGTTDFSSILTSFKQQSPDLVIGLQSPEEAVAIFQQAAQLGVARYGLNDAMTPDEVLDAQGLEDFTVIIPNFSPNFSPSATIPDYQPEEIFGNEEPAGNPGAAIDMYYTYRLLAQAMEEAGTATDAAAIAEALPGQSYDGPFGTCTMSENRDLRCETVLDVIEKDTVAVYRFPEPEAVDPSDVYECRGGECKPQ